jgi:hypothetical protein
MSGFILTIVDLMMKVGVNTSDIFVFNGQVSIPGYYRAAKQWDIVVHTGGRLLAVMELKSQVGSFGNNLNNRSEEAIGNAVDLFAAYREGVYGQGPRPWLGYMYVMEDSPKAHRSVGTRAAERHYPVLPGFRGASYAKRCELLCLRLIREGLYDAACLITTDRQRASLKENYTEPCPELSAGVFLSQLLRHVAHPLAP